MTNRSEDEAEAIFSNEEAFDEADDEDDEDDEDEDDEGDWNPEADEATGLTEDLYAFQRWLGEWESHQMTLDSVREVIGARLPDWTQSELETGWGALTAGVAHLEAVTRKLLDVMQDYADEEGWTLPDPPRRPDPWAGLEDEEEEAAEEEEVSEL